ncbi:unnamed protein product [Rotaria sp. Silwood2]|nr:unnamed protein product [Rotaria sp. Silwood2]
MNRIFSWFYNKNNSSSLTVPRRDFIESLIVHKQIKEFSSCLCKKDDRILCIDGFFRLLPTILDEKNNDLSIEYTIEFLLKQGARIDNMSGINSIITNLLSNSRSMIPFMLLDYSLYIDIPFQTWASQQMNFEQKFEEFKSGLSEQTVKLIKKFIDLKNPSPLSKLCLQKLRRSLKHLGDDMIDKLKDHLPNRLRQSITLFGQDECLTYFRSVTHSG